VLDILVNYDFDINYIYTFLLKYMSRKIF